LICLPTISIHLLFNYLIYYYYEHFCSKVKFLHNFEEHGEVVSAQVIIDKYTGNSRRFGFVEMKIENEALKAIKELDDCEFDNSQIVVKKARPRNDSARQKGYEYNRY